MITDQEEEKPSKMAANEQAPDETTKMNKSRHEEDRKFVEREYYRMGFDKDSRWRISDINKDFELCNTYPRFLIVPSTFTDEDLESVAKFRYFRRIPTAVWRHLKNGCFIVRSSQPTVGWFGWFRSELDENLVQTYVNNTIHQRQQQELQSLSESSCASEQANDNDNHHEDQVDSCGLGATNESRLRENGAVEGQHNTSLNGDCTHLNGKNGILANGRSQNTPNFQNGDILAEGISIPNSHQNDLDQSDTSARVLATLEDETYRTSYNSTASSDDAVKSLSDGLAERIKISGERAVACDITPHKNGHIPEPPSPPSEESNNNDPKSPVQQTLASNLTYSSDISTSTSANNISTTTSSSSATPTTNTTASTLTSPIPAATNTPKMLIIDARSYAAAMANRAKGGGCECSEYYQQCEVHFMNLANIHSIRKSYHAIRGVCEAYSEQSNNWVSFLDNSRWLHHISGLLRSALLVVDAIDAEEKSILIHCSDGWDRTPQLVALAEIMLDPHYRSFDGFRTLIQREWLDFGHKFADRCGSNPCNEDPNERCPVFLQWLDCVQQLLVQYPKHFEFNSCYLDKLNRHTYSNIFGTFSYNSTQERILSRIDERMGSLWSYFDSARDKYKNENYVQSEDILKPSFKVKDLYFWKEVYLPPVNQPTKLNLQMPFVPITTTTETAAAAATITATSSSSSSSTTTSTTATINNTPTSNNIDSNKCSHDSLYMDGLTRTVCK